MVGLLRRQAHQQLPDLLPQVPGTRRENPTRDAREQELCPLPRRNRRTDQPTALPQPCAVPDRGRLSHRVRLSAQQRCEPRLAVRHLPFVSYGTRNRHTAQKYHAVFGKRPHLRNEPLEHIPPPQRRKRHQVRAERVELKTALKHRLNRYKKTIKRY